MESHNQTQSVKARAFDLGFNAVGIADLSRNEHEAHLEEWLSSGMAGTMAYMHRQAPRRIEPARILPGASRAIVVMKNYFNEDPPRNSGTGRIAKYARGRDYHYTLQEPLSQLVDHVLQLGDNQTIARAYVDAGPVPERELGQRAGLGWIGRNTMLIHPRFGSHLFLAEVLTNLDLTVDRPFSYDRCGSCRRCIDACPTGAITEHRMVDSRLCVSYLTIEYKGAIEEGLQELMGERVFGCDECQDVCPWNVKFAECQNDPLLSLESANADAALSDLLHMTPDWFQHRFARTPLARSGIDGIIRNARVVAKNLESRD